MVEMVFSAYCFTMDNFSGSGFGGYHVECSSLKLIYHSGFEECLGES